MKPIRMSEYVAAHQEAVFAAFADFENATKTVSAINEIEMLTEGPVAQGTRFRETRTVMKREATEVMEVTRYEAGKAYTLECNSCGAHFSSTFEFHAEGDGTRVDFEMTSTPVTLMAKLMSPISSLMAGTMKKCMAQDMADVKRAVEGNANAAGA